MKKALAKAKQMEVNFWYIRCCLNLAICSDMADFTVFLDQNKIVNAGFMIADHVYLQ